MLGVNATFEGDKVLIHGLEQLEEEIPGAIKDGLGDIIDRIHIAAIRLLQGPGRGVKKVTAKKSGRQRAVPQRPELAGGYPVPRVTSHLLRLLGSLKPGKSKTSNGLTFTTLPMEAMLYDSARYADQIKDGTGSSEKYGPRPFDQDGTEEVVPEMPAIMNARINSLVSGLGL